MTGVNDKLVVVFEPQKGPPMKLVILQFRDIVARPMYEQREKLVRGFLFLNRPDTFDEGVVNQYRSRIFELKNRLLELGVVIAEENIVEFASERSP